MVKIKKLTDLAQIDLGLTLPNAEESTSFIDDTDTSSLSSKSNGESSSSGEFYLDYRSIANKDKSVPDKSVTSNNQENQAVHFDTAREAITFGSPFVVNEFAPQTVETSARFQCTNESKNIFRRVFNYFKRPDCFCLLKCCACCR